MLLFFFAEKNDEVSFRNYFVFNCAIKMPKCLFKYLSFLRLTEQEKKNHAKCFPQKCLKVNSQLATLYCSSDRLLYMLVLLSLLRPSVQVLDSIIYTFLWVWKISTFLKDYVAPLLFGGSIVFSK